MKAKKSLALLLVLTMILSLLPAMSLTAAADGEDPWGIGDASTRTVYYTILDESDQPTGTRSVTAYEDSYLNSDSEYTVRLYVPEGADKDSPICYIVNNSGWSANGHMLAGDDANLWGATDETAPAKLYPATHSVATPTNDNYGAGKYAGQALEAGYVVVTAEVRSRGNDNHSPVTVGDTKAVIRYLRHNADQLPAGDVDYIIVSGMSGGGALTSAIGASGNSTDYLPYLYALGAAGVAYVGEGDGPDLTNYMDYDAADFTDSLRDDVFAVVVYAPITDLSHADMAYAWTYLDARLALKALTTNAESNYFNDAAIESSQVLGEEFVEYVNSLGLTYNGEAVTATFNPETGETGGVLKDVIDDLMKESVQYRIDNPDAPYFLGLGMTEAMEARSYANAYSIESADDAWKTAWLEVAEDESETDAETFDLDAYLYYVAGVTALKNPPAFDGAGGPTGERRTESNLYGLAGQNYNHVLQYAFVNDAYTIGLYDPDNNDAETAWNNYVESGDYAKVQLQARMVNSIPYLLDSEGSDQGDSAPHWYLRMGMLDRDTSFATVALLYLSLLNAEDVEDVDARFTWDRIHAWQPYHDTPDSFEWVQETVAAAKAAEEPADPLSFENAEHTRTINCTVDGEATTVEMYEACYLASPTDAENQKISIYVPEGATKDSPILFMVNNSGWQSDAYSARTQVKDLNDPAGGGFGGGGGTPGVYVSDSDSDKIGAALSRNMVIVSYGCRSRNDAAVDGEYLGHSPATMTDTKAAIRYLRYNADLLPAGDTDRIVITGTSGGGALSTVIAASGNSPDYFESLYEIGAAGIVKNADGTYTSTIGDDVWGVIAYCPITDLGNACAAYEWMFNATRYALAENEKMSYTDASRQPLDNDYLLGISDELAEVYVDYFNGLGLKDENGETITADNLAEHIEALMRKEIEESIEEIGIEQMKADVVSAITSRPTGEITGYRENNGWITLNDDGTYEYDFAKHLYYLATYTTLKVPSGFSNYGLGLAGQNEDSLFGTKADLYSPFNEYSWNNDAIENNVGKDDTDLTWDEYMETEAGQYLALQIKMASAVAYLVENSDKVDTAPYWYVRHGMDDRDTSFAVETSLYYSALNNDDVEDLNFEFAWLKVHSGDYDVQEAYTWLDEALAAAEEAETEEKRANADSYLSLEEATVTTLTPHVDGEDVTVTWYADTYVAAPNRSQDQMINIYVPENATADSPIMFYVNNSGWQSNGYPTNTIQSYGTVEQTDRNGNTTTVTVGDYASEGDRVGVALSRGYVVVSYGCRSRNNGLTGDEYLGHSPATMTDTKAAIRYLKLNADLLPAGDVDRIVVTGTSGGGALSTVIAASGNSPDYFESLYEIGAAGIVKNADGTYTSTIGDDVWGVIAYCPITDLGNACAAYEWQYNATRYILAADGTMSYTNAQREELDNEYLLSISDALVPVYVEYINGLGLVDEDGVAITADNLAEHIAALMKKEIEESIQEIGIEQMQADLDAVAVAVEWLELNEDGSYTYDYDAHLEWLARKQTLKVPSGFSNLGMGLATQNEDSLFGSRTDAYSPFNPYSWDNDATENAVGKDDTGLTWDEYMETEAGQELALQIKMASAVAYLVENSAEVDTAPYWYVRHGMADRDTSFAVETTLYYSALNNDDVEDLNFEFAWLKPHAGNYDVDEAYAWLAEVLAAAEEPDNPVIVVPGTPTKPSQPGDVEPVELPFIDVDADDWYYDAVEYVYAAGLMNGMSDTIFAPEYAVSRAMVVQTLYRMEGEPAVTGTNSFTDLTADWYKDAVQWAVVNGITTGRSETIFDPDADVTREELATFLYRYAKYSGVDVSSSESTSILGYADAGEVSQYAVPAIKWAVGEGIIIGRTENTLVPGGTAKRAELATMLMRLCENVK